MHIRYTVTGMRGGKRFTKRLEGQAVKRYMRWLKVGACATAFCNGIRYMSVKEADGSISDWVSVA